MDVYLVRHAIAEPRDETGDHPGRRLTPEGRERLRRVALGLARLGVGVEAVLASPYARAWETAEVLAEELGWPQPEECPLLEPGVLAERCLAGLGGRTESSLAIVGHEPNLSELASLLLTARDDLVRFDLRKAGVVCLETPALLPAAAMLRWLAPPRMLRRLAG